MQIRQTWFSQRQDKCLLCSLQPLSPKHPRSECERVCAHRESLLGPTGFALPGFEAERYDQNTTTALISQIRCSLSSTIAARWIWARERRDVRRNGGKQSQMDVKHFLTILMRYWLKLSPAVVWARHVEADSARAEVELIYLPNYRLPRLSCQSWLVLSGTRKPHKSAGFLSNIYPLEGRWTATGTRRSISKHAIRHLQNYKDSRTSPACTTS